MTPCFTPILNSRLSASPTTVANTSDEPITGRQTAPAPAAITGKISTAAPAKRARPITSVRRASSRREVITCSPLMRMKQIENSSADVITERGISASSVVSFGSRPSARNSTPIAMPTRRLATPVAEASPTDGVEVFVPTALSSPARAVEMPSASTPRVAERMSGRTQSASTMRWHTVIVPSAFIAAARQAIAKGRAMASSNDHDR